MCSWFYFVLLGLYKTNNFAAILSLILFSLSLVIYNKYKFSLTRKNLILTIAVFLIYSYHYYNLEIMRLTVVS